jgi:hypothetical protein
MHKITPAYTALGVHTAGGANSLVGEVDTDEAGMRTGGNSPGGQSGMAGEMGGKEPAHMSYGFTSVVAKATGLGSGMGKGAESLMSFAGGNRSFPMMGAIFDRRHALKNLLKDVGEGASAMFGLKEWGQQLLNQKEGWFMTGNVEKKMRFQLVENDQQQQGGGQGGGGGGSGGGGGGGGQQSAGGEDLGQKSLHKKESKYYVEITKKMIEHVHEKRHKIMLDDKETAVDIVEGEVYVGKVKEKAQHQKLAHRGSLDSRGHGIIARVSTNTWTPPGA